MFRALHLKYKHITVLTGSWGSGDLGRHLRLTLISGCYSNLCEEKGRNTKKKTTATKSEKQIGSHCGRDKHGKWNREVHTQTRQKHNVVVLGWQFAQLVCFLIYSHPTQLLIRRKGPGRDHLDGVLLQSSGTKHRHRPLRSDINILLSQRCLGCILDCCSVPGASG